MIESLIETRSFARTHFQLVFADGAILGLLLLLLVVPPGSLVLW
ncbi:MAG TPA: hypothetical protein VFF30_03150 [Nitrososphaerales archaeon]|nr:hypothetical protein [Nitrososphaerales archaeon]